MLPTRPLWTPSGWRDKDEETGTVKSPTRWASRPVTYLDHDVGTLSVVPHVVESERVRVGSWVDEMKGSEGKITRRVQLF